MHTAPLNPPPAGLVPLPRFDKAAAEHVQLAQDAAKAHHAAGRLEDKIPEARDADAKALADAKRARKDDPGEVNVKALEAEIVQARRDAAALDRAVRDSRDELLAVVAAGQDAATAKLDAASAELRTKIVGLILREQLTAELGNLRNLRATRAWLTNPDRPYSPGAFGVTTTLRGPNGDPMRVDTVVAALIDAIDPPPAPPTNPHQGRTQPLTRRASAVGAALNGGSYEPCPKV